MHLAYLFDRVLPAHETDSEQALRTVAALAANGAASCKLRGARCKLHMTTRISRCKLQR